MLSNSVVVSPSQAGLKPEIAGKRVLITSLGADIGPDIARTFAAGGARLMVGMADDTPEAQALSEVLAAESHGIQVFHQSPGDADAVVSLTQKAAETHGGLDAVINLLRLPSPETLSADADFEELEDIAVTMLTPAFHATRVAANRMALTWSEGLILNILLPTHSLEGPLAVTASIAKTALSSLTRAEARNRAGDAIRINAVAPAVSALEIAASTEAALANEPEVAALAAYLMSQKGRKLSGYIFDAAV